MPTVKKKPQCCFRFGNWIIGTSRFTLASNESVLAKDVH